MMGVKYMKIVAINGARDFILPFIIFFHQLPLISRFAQIKDHKGLSLILKSAYNNLNALRQPI